MTRNILFDAIPGFLLISCVAAVGSWPHFHFSPFGRLRGHAHGMGEGVLETMMMERIQSRDSSPNWHPRSLERLLVVPEHKIMLCYVDPSPLNAVMNDLNGLSASKLDNEFGSSAISHFAWTVEETLAALHSPQWFKAVFFSDPLERLLAHYLVECKPGLAPTNHNASQARGRNCLFFEKHVMAGMSPTFPEFVQSLTEGMSMGGNGAGQKPLYNTHFVPQSAFCGGINISDYHYVGNLGEALEPQVKHILEKAQIPSKDVLRKHFHRSHSKLSLVQTTDDPSSASLPFGTAKVVPQVAKDTNLSFRPLLLKSTGTSIAALKTTQHNGLNASSQAHVSDSFFYRPTPTADNTQFPSDGAIPSEKHEFKRPSPIAFKENFKNVDTILAARNLYDADYQTLQEVTGAPAPAKICLNTIFALNFEKRRILDWIAYHSLMGVDCFLLFHDNERSDVSDPEVRAVYDELVASPVVTMFQAKSLSDRGRIANTAEWFKFFPATYLLVIDVDEFVVIDTPLGQARDTPPNLFDALENDVRVGEKGAVGVYLNRWDYGTGGYTAPPSLVNVPEFGQILERWGAQDRVRPEKNLGKMILNLRVGFPIFLSVHEWNHRSGGPMLFPNGTAMCLQECGYSSKTPPLPTTRQRISLNHYATGSLAECVAKAQLSKFSREDRGAECARLHPGTKEHTQLAATDGVAVDKSIVRYADATRNRRADLFPGADALLL